jgi:hypothetical protein
MTTHIAQCRAHHRVDSMSFCGVRIRARGALWCEDRADAGVAKSLSHSAAPRPLAGRGESRLLSTFTDYSDIDNTGHAAILIAYSVRRNAIS